jgi:hypothetical protein
MVDVKLVMGWHKLTRARWLVTSGDGLAVDGNEDKMVVNTSVTGRRKVATRARWLVTSGGGWRRVHAATHGKAQSSLRLHTEKLRSR